jgi:cytidylate kinase
MKTVITIDGPVASGKSTAAYNLAHALGFYHLNSGMLYRALAYAVIHNASVQCIIDDAQLQEYLNPQHIEYGWDAEGTVYLRWDGKDITPFLKTSEIDSCSSHLALRPHVHEFIFDIQRRLAMSYNLVADGRNIGSIVFPQALIKFYLTASPEERARRLRLDQEKRKKIVTLDEAITQIHDRDKRDKERNFAPLRIPEHAIIIDSSALSPKEVTDEMLKIVQKKLAETRSLSRP